MSQLGKKRRPRQEGLQKITALFPDETAQSIRSMSDEQGVTMSAVIVDLVRESLGEIDRSGDTITVPKNLSEDCQATVNHLLGALNSLIQADQRRHDL